MNRNSARPDEARKLFGKRIKDARNNLKIPQIAICKLIGVESEAYISRIESGLQDMPTKHFEIISDALKIEMNELFELRLNLERAKMLFPERKSK